MSHHHSHHPGHSHQVTDYNRAFAIGIVLNLMFVVIEVIYGVLSESLALIADAGHNLSDVFSLILAWGASFLARKAATEKRTYGLRKATVMASLASAILLLIALGGIAWEAVGRFSNPTPVGGMTVIVVAAIGVVINTLTALLFFSGQKDDLNIKGAFLHMAADAVVSLGVVIAGLFILFKGWLWIDPVISLIIVAVILVGTWGLLKDSMNYALDAVPDSVDIPALKQYLNGLESVERIHDLHVWPLSTTEIALTVHLVVSDSKLDNRFLCDQQQYLHDHFGIAHSTIQIESSTEEQNCMLDNFTPP
ncbi:cation diffusion facilitator family transporter [Amphritea pacifica]|uniref:cation diffusion facilitator family transporter n=1 Tax=Amphritea pacifica TaxID=2811233 RepID=UPI001963413A|nr:cation diffusion facilitator family transporter [Amphritea pacifica]MBN1005504.1 cation transporter [Amphritea pacifica]